MLAHSTNTAGQVDRFSPTTVGARHQAPAADAGGRQEAAGDHGIPHLIRELHRRTRLSRGERWRSVIDVEPVSVGCGPVGVNADDHIRCRLVAERRALVDARPGPRIRRAAQRNPSAGVGEQRLDLLGHVRGEGVLGVAGGGGVPVVLQSLLPPRPSGTCLAMTAG